MESNREKKLVQIDANFDDAFFFRTLIFQFFFRTLVASIRRRRSPPTLLDFFGLEPSDLERNENWGPSFVRGLSAVYTHLIIFGHGRCASRKHVSVHKKASVQ